MIQRAKVGTKSSALKKATECGYELVYNFGKSELSELRWCIGIRKVDFSGFFDFHFFAKMNSRTLHEHFLKVLR